MNTYKPNERQSPAEMMREIIGSSNQSLLPMFDAMIKVVEFYSTEWVRLPTTSRTLTISYRAEEGKQAINLPSAALLEDSGSFALRTHSHLKSNETRSKSADHQNDQQANRI